MLMPNMPNDVIPSLPAGPVRPILFPRQLNNTNHLRESNTNSQSSTMPPTDRKQILQQLRQRIDAGETIVGAGAGIGLSAKFIEAGGGDLIIIYNSGRFRMAGRGSLAGLMPYGNANDIVVDMVYPLPL
jgi:hypothetical protein